MLFEVAKPGPVMLVHPPRPPNQSLGLGVGTYFSWISPFKPKRLPWPFPKSRAPSGLILSLLYTAQGNSTHMTFIEVRSKNIEDALGSRSCIDYETTRRGPAADRCGQHLAAPRPKVILEAEWPSKGRLTHPKEWLWFLKGLYIGGHRVPEPLNHSKHAVKPSKAFAISWHLQSSSPNSRT